jgi:hypothetical protein
MCGVIAQFQPVSGALHSAVYHGMCFSYHVRRHCSVSWNLRDQKKAYDTAYSQAVTHPSTNAAQSCLTSVIGRELVFSTWYGRRHEVKLCCLVQQCSSSVFWYMRTRVRSSFLSFSCLHARARAPADVPLRSRAGANVLLRSRARGVLFIALTYAIDRLWRLCAPARARALGVIAQFHVLQDACASARATTRTCVAACAHGVIAQFQPQRSAVMQRARAMTCCSGVPRARTLGVIAQFEIECAYARPRMLQRAAAAAVLHVRAGRHCSVSSMHACPHGRGWGLEMLPTGWPKGGRAVTGTYNTQMMEKKIFATRCHALPDNRVFSPMREECVSS